MNFKKLKSQSGRSMVEMLGVLAIIGVLSVGGIAGYSLSMRRHRANQVVDVVSKFALLSYNFCYRWLESGNSDWEDVGECSHNSEFPAFSRAGLGDLPAGVSGVYFNYVEQDTTTGSDVVHMTTYFDDKKLCQAVASVVGTECSSDNAVVIKIKQN